jgi:hypothetical protein
MFSVHVVSFATNDSDISTRLRRAIVGNPGKTHERLLEVSFGDLFLWRIDIFPLQPVEQNHVPSTVLADLHLDDNLKVQYVGDVVRNLFIIVIFRRS